MGVALLDSAQVWDKQEFDAYGWPFPPVKERMEMLEEAVQIIKKMMTERPASYTGKHYALREALNDPRPVEQPHPPLLIGGGGEKRTLRLVAQYADWCNVSGSVEEVGHKFEVLRSHCEAVQRSYESITRSIDFLCTLGRDEGEAKAKAEQYGDFGGVAGTPESLIELLQAYAAIGVEYATVAMPDAAKLEAIHLFGDRILPALASM